MRVGLLVARGVTLQCIDRLYNNYVPARSAVSDRRSNLSPRSNRQYNELSSPQLIVPVFNLLRRRHLASIQYHPPTIVPVFNPLRRHHLASIQFHPPIVCKAKKMTRLSLSIIERNTSLPLQHLRSDLIGLFPFMSLGGAKYFVIVLVRLMES